MRLWPALASALAFAFAVACESTEGLSGGPPDTDGGAGEAGAGFCADKTGAAACAAFDGADLDPGWASRSLNGGAVSLDKAKARSGAGSLLATSQPLTVARSAAAAVHHALPVWSSRATIELDVLVEQVDVSSAAATAVILSLTLVPDAPGAPSASVGISMTASGAALVDTTAGTAAVVPFKRGFTKGLWTHITLVVDVATGKASGSLDQESMGEVALRRQTLPTTSTLAVGLGVNGPAEAWAVRFDDVVVRVE